MDRDESNWYGMAFNRIPREVRWSNETELLRWSHKKDRFWVLAATDRSGRELGGLAVRSTAWGPPPFTDWRAPPMKYASATNFSAHETFANHWWLAQDAYVQNAANTREKIALLSPGPYRGRKGKRTRGLRRIRSHCEVAPSAVCVWQAELPRAAWAWRSAACLRSASGATQ